MFGLIRKIPILGKITEIVANDPYKDRLKNALRRNSASAGLAIAILCSPLVAGILGCAVNIVGNGWEDIDKWIDSLDEDTVKKIYWAIAVSNAS